eukprot:3336434-Amphidinium_carterae.1
MKSHPVLSCMAYYLRLGYRRLVTVNLHWYTVQELPLSGQMVLADTAVTHITEDVTQKKGSSVPYLASSNRSTVPNYMRWPERLRNALHMK